MMQKQAPGSPPSRHPLCGLARFPRGLCGRLENEDGLFALPQGGISEHTSSHPHVVCFSNAQSIITLECGQHSLLSRHCRAPAVLEMICMSHESFKRHLRDNPENWPSRRYRNILSDGLNLVEKCSSRAAVDYIGSASFASQTDMKMTIF